MSKRAPDPTTFIAQDAEGVQYVVKIITRTTVPGDGVNKEQTDRGGFVLQTQQGDAVLKTGPGKYTLRKPGQMIALTSDDPNAA